MTIHFISFITNKALTLACGSTNALDSVPSEEIVFDQSERAADSRRAFSMFLWMK